MPIIRAVCKDGKVTLTAEGFVGPACQAATAPFLERLGLKPSDVKEELTQEFYQEVEPTVEQQQGLGDG